MTSLPPDPTDRLYALLPAVYRLRDGAAGEPLRALLSVIESELLVVENDITALYDNWFIETCAPWVVPYIGDLLDVRDLYADNPLTYGQQERRAYVANTLAYRRRKGTTPVLEQLARDVTGWRSRAVEFSRLLLTTQQLNHVRSTSATVNLRTDHRLQQIGTPFEQQAAYSAEIRPVRQGGRYQLPSVGLFIWRLQNYPVQRGTARAVAGADPEPTGRYYTFNPLGQDQVPLFNQPQTETNIVNLADEINVPGTLRRVALSNELNARHRALLNGQRLDGVRYFDRDPVLQIFINGQPNPIPPEEILICSLQPPEASTELTDLEADDTLSPAWQAPLYEAEQGEDELSLPTKVVAVDPELGRLAFLDKPLPRRVDVSYLYGFSDDVGGGPYPRSGAEQSQPDPAFQTSSNPQFISPLYGWIDPTLTADPNPLATAIHTWNQTTTAWETLTNQTSVRLATIQIPPVQVSQIDREKVRRFVPGMVGTGLQVIGRAGQKRVIITAGQAIDGQGRRITVREDFSLDLGEFAFAQYPDRTDYPHCTGWLVAGYQSAAQKQSTSARHRLPVQFVPEPALKGYSRGTFIPLARITLDSENRLVDPPEQEGRLAAFQPGVLQGLEVKMRPGTLEAVVTVGTAIDPQGRPLMATTNQPLDLAPYQGETRLVIISRDVRLSRRSHIELIHPNDPTLTTQRPYVLLASLDIPRVTLRLNPIQPTASASGLIPQPTYAPALPAASSPVEPTTNSIRVTVARPDRAIVTVSAGMAMDGQQQIMTLEQDCQFDLSRYAAQTLVLFISRQPNLGLPLDPVSTSRGQSWQQIGLVPQEPGDSDTGTLVLKGNQTYVGDLFLKLPATRRLTVIASEGSRPHIQGNLYVQGSASPDQEQPGELRLNGLLIEGHLTVLAGNLKHLQISHCTLVPEEGGIRVKKGSMITPPPPEDDPSWLALLMYGLSLIWQLIHQDWQQVCAPMSSSTSPRPIQLVQFALQQLTRLTSEIWETMQTWQCSDDPDETGFCGLDENPSTLKQGNARLEIVLERSICGPLYLADTVPQLTVVDSILDKGQTHSDARTTSGTAIAAPGTDVEIRTSTVLGMSLVRSLEASNSLFTEKVTALRHQVGCIRFSHVPEGSQTPRRYQCQPDMALKQELDPLPEAITALGLAPYWDATHPDHTDPNNRAFLLLGTAGGGVFRSYTNGEQWEPIEAALPDRHITASLVYYQSGIGLIRCQGTRVTGISIPTNNDTPGRDAVLTTRFTQQVRPGDRLLVAQTTRTVVAVLNDAELVVDAAFSSEDLTDQSFQLHTLLIGTTSGTLFRYQDGENSGASWTPVGLGHTNAPITTLLHTAQPGTGTVSGQGMTLTGVGTRFASELRVGDAIALTPTAPGSPQTRQVVAFGQPGTGTISSQETTVSGSHPDFANSLNPGDTLTVLGHTRTVVRRQTDPPNTVEINTPFPTDLPPGTTFQRNIDTVLTINAPFDEDALPTTTFQIPRLYAATAGGGVFYAPENGEQWQPLNQGIAGLNVTALAVNPTDGQLFAGTVGSGVWRFVKRDEENGISEDRWMSANSSGLTHRTITALAIAPSNHLWAGTAGGGIFYTPIADLNWKAMNQGLTSLNITTLAIGIREIEAESLPILFTGTSDGRLFRSIELSSTLMNTITDLGSQDADTLWSSLSLDLKGIDITALICLVLPSQTSVLWLGTATGEVQYSLDRGISWQSMDHGLPNVAEKLQILDRLTPTFTSMQYGNPGYGQLRQSCAQEIRVGAEDGAEMGVFNALKQPQREANLQASLEEYLRFGLEAGIFYVT